MGYQRGGIIHTAQGPHEENMPGLWLIPPTNLAKDQPEFLENLKANSKVLTSHFDLNKLLRHLVALGTGKSEKELFNEENPFGVSLLRPLGARTCVEAGIPLDYCTCPQAKVSLNSSDIAELVEAVLEDLNKFLTPVSGCISLKAEDITKASAKIDYDMVSIQTIVVLPIKPAQLFMRVTFPKTDLSKSEVHVK